MESLRGLIGCGHYWAEQRAQIALELSDRYARQELTREEYIALLDDIINTDELDAEANDIAVKGVLVAGIMNLVAMA
jgi:hypothetical protein